MRITLNFLDNFLDQPDLEQHFHSDYVLVVDQTFQRERIVLDNHQFARCRFQGVTLLYSGAPFALVDCDIDAYSGVSLTGSAARGFVLWKKFDEMPGRHLPGEV